MSDPLSIAAFIGYLAICSVAHPVIAEVPTNRAIATAQAESRLHPFAIGDNDTGRSYFPATREEAAVKARELLALGHRIDAGVMQVTDRNWPAYGLTVDTVFEPRANICAGGRILGEAFAIERRAHCRYNTGRPTCTNGYPARVDAAEAALSGIRVAGTPGGSPVVTPPPSPAPVPSAEAVDLLHPSSPDEPADEAEPAVVLTPPGKAL